MRAASTEEHRKRGKQGAISICLCLRRSRRPEDDIIYQNRLEIDECRWRRRPLWDLRTSNRLSAPWHSFCEYQSDHPEQCDCHPVALNLRVVANLIRKLADRLTRNNTTRSSTASANVGRTAGRSLRPSKWEAHPGWALNLVSKLTNPQGHKPVV